ncbi:hypothetical protein [Meiothermus rufus]|uniref:hypothetical protein n=1 Tax=Meiothermus rufus TaxID=604332 RepID=UPI00041C2DD9|nr:hypothetical protein [Meiothermus rufus]
MPVEAMGLLLFLVTACLVFLPIWLARALGERRQQRELQALERMYRFARKHNTFVRNHQGVRYVVVLGKQGFHYMLWGQMVSRQRLLKALGEEHERVLLKAESEESQHGPTLISITVPA